MGNKTNNSLKKFKEKYLYGIKNTTLFRKRRKRYINKIENIPTEFWEVFDEKSYLAVNLDIKESIRKGTFESAIEHFIIFIV